MRSRLLRMDKKRFAVIMVSPSQGSFLLLGCRSLLPDIREKAQPESGDAYYRCERHRIFRSPGPFRKFCSDLLKALLEVIHERLHVVRALRKRTLPARNLPGDPARKPA